MDEKFIQGVGLEIRATERYGCVRRVFEYDIKMASKEMEQEGVDYIDLVYDCSGPWVYRKTVTTFQIP